MAMDKLKEFPLGKTLFVFIDDKDKEGTPDFYLQNVGGISHEQRIEMVKSRIVENYESQSNNENAAGIPYITDSEQLAEYFRSRKMFLLFDEDSINYELVICILTIVICSCEPYEGNSFVFRLHGMMKKYIPEIAEELNKEFGRYNREIKFK